jgi:hypothetical protein
VKDLAQQVRERVMPVATELLRAWHIERGFPEGMAALLRDLHTVELSAVQQFTERTLGHLLPGLSIRTELYALYETDRDAKKPLSSNDWFDSSHAAAALPYCGVFLTERNLAHKLRQLLKADVQYGCQVIGSLGGGFGQVATLVAEQKRGLGRRRTAGTLARSGRSPYRLRPSRISLQAVPPRSSNF